ncbi:hypothetical protein COO59_11005 [Mixta theicola]|uniref:DUF3289 domain-containing protein n=1 Tax=Mixta theicola TaxID=1458355 RepID=A0A2K1Q938_9GAMM|nr:DUF3289 family protein [Mixta theicola]PNS11544.1 hypothetical protein COO59_11005 [Mixta theicola]GLR08632.1 hypothetical protein GCM10007905_13510 [Mixta theicola]
MTALIFPCTVFSTQRKMDDRAAADMALRNQLLKDNSGKSSLKAIESVINNGINYKQKNFPKEKFRNFDIAIQTTILPKFARKEDSINGLGITVHDIYSIEIKLLSLQIFDCSWEAAMQYVAQDHFGLDDNDIMKNKFRQFKFFRIWFILQHYDDFGYKPFFTNMSATIKLSGSKK